MTASSRSYIRVCGVQHALPLRLGAVIAIGDTPVIGSRNFYLRSMSGPCGGYHELEDAAVPIGCSSAPKPNPDIGWNRSIKDCLKQRFKSIVTAYALAKLARFLEPRLKSR